MCQHTYLVYEFFQFREIFYQHWNQKVTGWERDFIYPKAEEKKEESNNLVKIKLPYWNSTTVEFQIPMYFQRKWHSGQTWDISFTSTLGKFYTLKILSVIPSTLSFVSKSALTQTPLHLASFLPHTGLQSRKTENTQKTFISQYLHSQKYFSIIYWMYLFTYSVHSH